MPNINLDILLSGGEKVTTEIAEIDKSIDSVGKSGKRSGSEMAAGLSGIERAAKDSARSVASAGQSAANYSHEIRDARAELARMGSQLREAVNGFGAKSAAATNLKTKMADLAANIRGMVAEQAILVAESKVEKQAVEASTSAFDKKTNRISVGRGILSGYDAAVESLVRASGGLNLSTAIGIGLFSNLLPLLLSLGKAERERIEISKEMIATDLTRIDAQTRNIRVNADLIASMVVIAAEQRAYRLNTHELKDALSVLQTEGKRTVEVFADTGGSYERVVGSSKDLRSEVGSLNTEIVKQEKTLLPAIEALISYRDKTGKSTEEIIRFAEQTGRFAPAALQFFREQLDATLPFIDAFSEALTKLRVPQFSLGATPQGIKAQDLAVQEGLFTAMQQGVTDLNTAVRATSPTIKALDENLKRNSGSVAEYKNQVGGLSVVTQDAIERLNRQDRAYNENFKSSHRGASATRAYANELINLTKQANQAEAALTGSTFGQRERLISEEADALRKHLVVNKRDRAAALAEIDRMERAQIAGVARAREDAEQQLQDRIRGIEIEGIANERQRRLAQIEFEVDKEADKLNRMFDDDIAAFVALDDFRRALVGRFNRWEEAQRRAALANLHERERAFAETIAEERLKKDKKTLAAVVKIVKQSQDAVHKFFGFIGRDNRTFQLQLRALERFGKRDIFGGLIDSLRVLGSELINGGVLAQSFGDSIENAFARALGSGESFLRSFAASLIEGLTQIVAQMLSQIGTQLIAKGTADILMGIALNANPLTPGAGTALIAAGKAELAQGLILKAAAGIISGLGQLASNAVAGKGSSGAAGGGGSSAAGGTVEVFTRP